MSHQEMTGKVMLNKDDAFIEIEFTGQHWIIRKFTPDHQTSENPFYEIHVGDNVWWAQAMISVLKYEGWAEYK
jgi:hypothetical protein